MADLLHTPLYAAHVTEKARLVPFAGWEMPVQYAGVLAEVKAVRENAGLFDVSHMGRLRVHGPDAVPYLQFLVVSDVTRLPLHGGTAQYSLLCLESGGIIDDILIYRIQENEFLIVVNASNKNKDLSWLRRHVGEYDVIIDDETEQTALLALQGPDAVALATRLSDRDLSVMPRFGLDETVIADVPCVAARTGYTGEDGLELFCASALAETLWFALLEAGAVPCGLGARDTLRLEAALPLYGHEMDEHTTPFEARLGWVVRTEKQADFLGKHALSDLKKAKRRKVLVGVEMEGRAIPRDGYPVMAGETIVGTVTSGTFSPMRNKGIALVRVDATHSEIGSPLDVVVRETRHPARVAVLPFYKNL